MHAQRLLLLGTGQLAKEVIEQCEGSRHIIASTRNPNRIFELAAMGVEPLIMPLPSAEIVEHLAEGADVLISFPPDGSTDAIIAPACASARCLIYISSTGVYGRKSGRIDDGVSVDPSDERMRPRLQAESIWREHGAIVLRPPGIYGPQSGLHKRLSEGDFKIPGTGENVLSRIHVYDLAAIILSIFELGIMADTTYLVADEKPCSMKEVLAWLCNELNLPLPERVAPEHVNPSLRGNRSIDASRILKELGYQLKYPTYKEGYLQCIEKQEIIESR